jgi:hypothetical protein
MMRKLQFLTACLFFIINEGICQYCMLTGQTPYSTLQPGITNFQLNTINRTSGNSESTSAVVVTTGQTTTLTAGQTYTFSISHSEDYQFFPGARNNLRVWIDYNSNNSYSDAGETVLSANLLAPGTTYTTTFTLPVSVPAGTLNLRATAKMSADAGHSLPTPCNVPADPLGYHGEMEDYTIVVINTGSGTSPVANFMVASSVCVNAALTVSNVSTGSPTPTYSWNATPSAGVTFSPNSTSVNPKLKFTQPGTYTILCTAVNSNSTSSASKTVTVSSCNFLGLEKETLSEFLIGPNPANDHLNISGSAEGITDILIRDQTGRLLFEQKSTGVDGKITLDVNSLSPGIYVIKVLTANKQTCSKLLISR